MSSQVQDLQDRLVLGAIPHGNLRAQLPTKSHLDEEEASIDRTAEIDHS